MTKARDLANASTALSAVSATELAFVDGVTSAIQTQLDAKAPSSTAVTLTGTQTLTNKTLTSPVLTTPTISTVNAKGDLLAGTADNTVDRLAVGNDGEQIVADSTASTGLSYQPNFAAGKNAIINGAFNNWQRGTSISLTNNTQVYCADRYLISSTFSAGTSSFAQQTFTPGTAPVAGYEGTFFGRLTCGSTATNFSLFQRIEDVRKFAGQTVTISFWAKSSATPQLQVYAQQNFGSGGSAGVDYYAGAITLTSSWVRYSKTFAVSSIASKTIGTSSFFQVGFYYDGVGSINSATVDTWGWQVEAAPNATAFQTATGTLQGELAACQRYYFRNTANASNPNAILGPFGFANTTANFDMQMSPPVTMRTTPTSVDYSNLQIYWVRSGTSGSTGSLTSVTLTNLMENQINVAFGKTGAFTVGDWGKIQAANSATAYIGFSAEL